MRIGFVGMSGVRVVDEELLRIGLTLPGFVERSVTIASLPSLGILTLAGMTPGDEHERLYFEAEDVNGAERLPRDLDLLAISALSAQAPRAYEVAERFRAAGVPVVMGGLHATALPDEAARHCDSVVVGEGESCWADVLEDAKRGRLKERYDGRAKPFDLAQAPMPAFELLNPGRYNRITVQTCRGCPFKCEFCASSIMLSPKFKQKPIESVLAEIDRVRELWPRPFIEFADDNSFVNKGWWKRLLPELAKRGVRWFTETDVSVADDAELLDLMREAGCVEVLIGLESPVEDGLSGLELRADWKRRRRADYVDAVRRIQSRGIRVNGCFIIGLDGQGPDIFDRVYDFAEETSLFDVQVTLPTPFPGTPLYRRLKETGRLRHDGDWGRCTLFDLMFEPSPMSAEELRRGFLDLVARLYDDEFLRRRRLGFMQGCGGLRPPPMLANRREAWRNAAGRKRAVKPPSAA